MSSSQSAPHYHPFIMPCCKSLHHWPPIRPYLGCPSARHCCCRSPLLLGCLQGDGIGAGPLAPGTLLSPRAPARKFSGDLGREEKKKSLALLSAGCLNYICLPNWINARDRENSSSAPCKIKHFKKSGSCFHFIPTLSKDFIVDLLYCGTACGPSEEPRLPVEGHVQTQNKK